MRVVLATGNAGKLREMRTLLAPLSMEVLPQSDFDTPEAIEDGLSFVENAIIKARNAAAHCDLPALADDSGLEVAALDGAPGIYSSRFAGENASDADNIEKLLHDLADLPAAKRTARFRCVMVYLRHAKDPSPVIAEGSWNGRILQSKEGDGGFGYDPVFYAPETDCAVATLSSEQKNALSHRGKASRAIVKKLQALANTDDAPEIQSIS
ncbi:MAG: RdgB/HAM1 family non-canonical purine NTP pyrophosphatase [Pseudomonadota bacterium]